MKPIDRRTFLAQSSTLAFGGPYILKNMGRRNTVRVAVVGTGGRGTELVRNLTTIKQAEIVAVCDDYEPHLANGAEAAGPQVKSFLDYDQMLKDIQPQAVVVAVPLHLHYEMSAKALEAGAGVFCEKSMCYSNEQAQQLAELVASKEAVFQVGFQRRSSSIYQTARQWVEEGRLGRITSVKCQWHRNGSWRRPVPAPKTDPQWEALERRINWRLYHPYSHGLITELASHQMDVAAWFLGTYPYQVMATGGLDYWRDGREVFDNIYCIYNHHQPPYEAGGEPYDVRVTFSSIQTNAFEGASELIMGTNGTLMLTERRGLLYKEAGVEDPGWAETPDAEADAQIITSGKTLKWENDPWESRGAPLAVQANANSTRTQLVSFLDHVHRNDPNTIAGVDIGLRGSVAINIGHEALHASDALTIPAV